MKLIIKENYQEMSALAANIIFSTMQSDKRVNLSLTAGNTPIDTYKILGELVDQQRETLDNVYFYNFDEVELKNDDYGETQRELDENLYSTLKVSKDKIHHYNMKNYKNQQKEIENAGGLDLMLLGMGDDGHFCGNMPGTTKFTEYSYKFKIERDAPWFPSYVEAFGDNTPDEMVTMGAPSIMKAKTVVLIINGKHKAKAVKRLLTEDFNKDFPSGILKVHPNLIVILDKDAASLL